MDLWTLFRFVQDIGMVVGPGVAFLFQAFKMCKLKTSEGYSNFVSFILLIANLLRVPFWFGKEGTTLVILLAAIYMIVVQFMMIWVHICYIDGPQSDVTVDEDARPIQRPPPEPFSDVYKCSAYWRWRRLELYAFHIVAYSVILFFFSALLLKYDIYVEVLGAVSGLVEATLALPQAIKNCKRKSTHGLSLILVFCWFGGDAFKTYYYFYRDVPLQLSICAVFQLSVDVLILMQFLYYNKIKSYIAKKRETQPVVEKKPTSPTPKTKYKRAEDQVTTDEEDLPSAKVQPHNPSQKSSKKKAKAFRTLVNQE